MARMNLYSRWSWGHAMFPAKPRESRPEAGLLTPTKFPMHLASRRMLPCRERAPDTISRWNWRLTRACRFKSCAQLRTKLTWNGPRWVRSEEHTSELQSRRDLVCRLLLEKKKNKRKEDITQERKVIKRI